MASTAATLAEAVRDAINAAPGGTFNATFTAERIYLPRYNPEEVTTDLRVMVIGRGLEFVVGTRKTPHRSFSVDVGVQKRLGQGSNPLDETGNTELDGLMELTEQLAGFFALGSEYGAGQLLTKVASPQLYDPTHLRSDKIFTSFVTLSFRVFS